MSPSASSSPALPTASRQRQGSWGGRGIRSCPLSAALGWVLHSLIPAGTCRLHLGGAIGDPSMSRHPWMQGQSFVLSQDGSSTGKGLWVPGWQHHSLADPELHFRGCRVCVGGYLCTFGGAGSVWVDACAPPHSQASLPPAASALSPSASSPSPPCSLSGSAEPRSPPPLAPTAHARATISHVLLDATKMA